MTPRGFVLRVRTPQPEGPDPEFTNAPGWTEIANTSFPTSGDAEASPPSPWSFFDDGDADGVQGNYRFVADATGPKSASGALEVLYADTGNNGDAPGRYFTSLGTVDQVYMAVWVRFDPDWQPHGSGINKIFPIKTNGSTLSWVTLRTDWWSGAFNGVGQAPPGSGVGGYIFAQEEGGGGNAGGDDRGGYFPQNVAAVEYHWGDWVKIEVLRDRTGGDGAGILRLWLDGTLVTEYADMTHSDPWIEALLEPTWGGGAENVVADMWVRHDHALVEAQ